MNSSSRMVKIIQALCWMPVIAFVLFVLLTTAHEIYISKTTEIIKRASKIGAEVAIAAISSNNTNVTFDILSDASLKIYSERHR